MEASKSTIRTIASEAGVTANTVSLALRGSKLVADQTKAKILEIAKKQAYIPNVLAESLRSGKSRTVALIFGNLFNPLFAIKTQKMEHILRTLHYQVLILNSNEDPDQELEVVETAISRKVDGIVLCPSMINREPLNILQKHSVPCVLVGRGFDLLQEDTVVWDNEQGGYLATKHLISQGCTRILHIGGAIHVSASNERYLGYVRALKEENIELDERLVVHPSSSNGGILKMLNQIRCPYDGVFAFSDLMLWEAACHVPSSVKMVGFDNIQSFFAAPLNYSSIAGNLEEEARIVVDLLLHRIENPGHPIQKVVLPVELVSR